MARKLVDVGDDKSNLVGKVGESQPIRHNKADAPPLL